MRIVINGVGIAGPTLAYWLRKAGHEVLLVESAQQLRSGGYIIDFGLVGYDIAEKMGLIPRIRGESVANGFSPSLPVDGLVEYCSIASFLANNGPVVTVPGFMIFD